MLKTEGCGQSQAQLSADPEHRAAGIPVSVLPTREKGHGIFPNTTTHHSHLLSLGMAVGSITTNSTLLFRSAYSSWDFLDDTQRFFKGIFHHPAFLTWQTAEWF